MKSRIETREIKKTTCTPQEKSPEPGAGNFLDNILDLDNIPGAALDLDGLPDINSMNFDEFLIDLDGIELPEILDEL